MGEYDDMFYDPPTPRKQVELKGQIERLIEERDELRTQLSTALAEKERLREAVIDARVAAGENSITWSILDNALASLTPSKHRQRRKVG